MHIRRLAGRPFPQYVIMEGMQQNIFRKMKKLDARAIKFRELTLK